MTQIRPRLGDDLAAAVQAFADRYSKEINVRVSFNAAVAILLRAGLQAKEEEETS